MEISFAGIEQAVEGLGYRSDKSPKSRLVYTLKKHYFDMGAVESVGSLDSDTLIDLMWELGGNETAIRSKRKNLSSIKSSVNADLNEAWELGCNPEGITIGPLNTFVMSDAAKNKILDSFSGAMNLQGGNSLDRVTEALKIVSEYLSNLPGGLQDDKLSNLKSLVEGLAGKFRSGGPGEFEITEKKSGDTYEEAALDGFETTDMGSTEGDDGEETIDGDTEENLEEMEAPISDDTEIIEVMEEDDTIEEPDEIELVDEDETLEEAGDGEVLPEDETEIEDISEKELDDFEEVIEEDQETLESDDTEIVEVMDEDDAIDEPDEVELMGEDEALEEADDGEVLPEDEAEIEDISEEELDDFEEVIEEEQEALESDDTEIVEVIDEDDAPDELDEVETVEDNEILEDAGDEARPPGDDTGIAEADGADFEDLEEVLEEDGIEEEFDAADLDEIGEVSELEADEPDESEIVNEDEILEDDGEDAEALEDDMEIEEIAEEDLDDFKEVLDEDTEDREEDDVVEVMDEADVSELEEADILEDEDVVEEVEEVESTEAEGGTEPDDEAGKNDVGLPLDQLAEEALNFEEFQPDEEQKRLLAERFDGYLGAMERYYNQYIIVNKGKYTIGANETEADVLMEQKVSLPDYYVGKYPVTNALFEVFIERTGYKTTAERLGFGYVYHGRFQKTVDPKTGLSRSIWNTSYTRKKVDGATWYQPTGPGSTLHQKRNHPVVQVSIKDARTFAAWTGKRLPTEIEWEAAARTQSGFFFPWGNEWRDGCCNVENSDISDTCPVDSYPRGNNATGLGDLLGNVLEWTADECEPKYPQEKPARFFIAKGGSWISHEKPRLFERTRFEAELTANIVGFRCLAD